MKNILLPVKKEIAKIRDIIYSRIYISKNNEKNIVNDFHRLYYDSFRFNKTWGNTYWQGYMAKKCPLDMWIYQEIIFDLKPDIIIECGTAWGGSALFLANMCDLVNNGKIITIEISNPSNLPKHPRIEYLTNSSSTDEKIVNKIKNQIKKTDKVLVILDSNHTKQHVLNELRFYNELVTKDSYLIVEDTQFGGNPVMMNMGDSPLDAIKEFFKENTDFIIDKTKEKFYMTFNPNGYLKKIK